MYFVYFVYFVLFVACFQPFHSPERLALRGGCKKSPPLRSKVSSLNPADPAR